MTSQVPALSVEFFPPKTPEAEGRFWKALPELLAVNPEFISITYGAGGSDRDSSGKFVCAVKEKVKCGLVAHLTCIGETIETIEGLLKTYRNAGINEILALRGDRADDMPEDIFDKSAFRYANELTAYLHNTHPDLKLGVAAYPETHPEASSPEADIEVLKKKQDAGGQYAITQFFYDNDNYARFLEKCQKAGITIPIIPGILPAAYYKQLVRFSDFCGAKVPDSIRNRMDPFLDDPDTLFKKGVELTAEHVQTLNKIGVPGIHIYTLNRSDATVEIVKALS
ncbi:MAG: methylenetetrahydrofolate reductase [Magnetococcales bacterium]|nr:methylenetetrahydrofolate reductase [Magnetococcales bacterium]